MLRRILDYLRTILFALLSVRVPEHIPELLFHFRWDLGRFTCCQVVALTAWQSPVKQIGLTLSHYAHHINLRHRLPHKALGCLSEVAEQIELL